MWISRGCQKDLILIVFLTRKKPLAIIPVFDVDACW